MNICVGGRLAGPKVLDRVKRGTSVQGKMFLLVVWKQCRWQICCGTSVFSCPQHHGCKGREGNVGVGGR